MIDDLAKIKCVGPDVLAKTLARYAGARRRRQVVVVAAPRMVAVAMGNDGAVYRPQGIDIEVSGWAIKPLETCNDEIHRFLLSGELLLFLLQSLTSRARLSSSRKAEQTLRICSIFSRPR